MVISGVFSLCLVFVLSFPMDFQCAAEAESHGFIAGIWHLGRLSLNQQNFMPSWGFGGQKFNVKVSAGPNSFEAYGENLSLPLPVSGSSKCSLACSCITPISPSIFTWPSSPPTQKWPSGRGAQGKVWEHGWCGASVASQGTPPS